MRVLGRLYALVLLALPLASRVLGRPELPYGVLRGVGMGLPFQLVGVELKRLSSGEHVVLTYPRRNPNIPPIL